MALQECPYCKQPYSDDEYDYNQCFCFLESGQRADALDVIAGHQQQRIAELERERNDAFVEIKDLRDEVVMNENAVDAVERELATLKQQTDHDNKIVAKEIADMIVANTTLRQAVRDDVYAHTNRLLSYARQPDYDIIHIINTLESINKHLTALVQEDDDADEN